MTSSTKLVLALVVTAPPWNLDKAEEEVGDTLYPLDPQLKVVRCASVLLVYTRLGPLKALYELMRTPPAFASRVVPVEYVCPTLDFGCVVEAVIALYSRKQVRGPLAFEVNRHGVQIDVKSFEQKLKETLTALFSACSLASGSRRPSWALVVEILPELTVVALIPYKLDRVQRWWHSKYQQVLQEVK